MSHRSKYTPECDYSHILDQKLQSVLVHGEQDWLKNAPETYGWDAINVWEEEIVPRILSGELRDIDIEDLELYCPNFLDEIRDYNF